MSGKQKDPVILLVNIGRASKPARTGIASAIELGIAATKAINAINPWNGFFWPSEGNAKTGPSGLQKIINQAAEGLRNVNLSREYKKKAIEKFGTGEFDEALNLLDKSINCFPFGEAYLYRAMAKIQTGLTVSGRKDLQKAAECFRMEVECSPKSSELHLNLGRSYFLIGDFRRAARAWENVAELEPKDAKICENIGIANAACGDFAGAMKAFQVAVARNPDMADSHCFMGTIWMGSYKQHREAELQFSKALKINPKHVEALCGRAEAKLFLKKFNDAYEDARAAYELAPKSQKAQDLLVKTADMVGFVDPKGWKMIETDVMQ